MKKIFTATFVCALALAQAQSKKEAALKLHYTPQTLYTIVQNTSMDMTLTYTGNEEVIEMLEAQGIENPMVNKEASQNVIEFSTGKPDKNKEFPVEMRFVSSTNKNLTKYFKPNTIVYGHGSEDAFPVFDSISDKSFDESFKTVFLQTMGSILSQIEYPEAKLKVGETASIDTPLSIPFGGATMEIKLTSNYKLLSIKGDVADYNIDMVATVAAEIEGYDMEMHGGGTGKMAYDLATNYYKSYDIDLIMEMAMDVDDVSIAIKLIQKNTATATVAKKK